MASKFDDLRRSFCVENRKQSEGGREEDQTNNDCKVKAFKN